MLSSCRDQGQEYCYPRRQQLEPACYIHAIFWLSYSSVVAKAHGLYSAISRRFDEGTLNRQTNTGLDSEHQKDHPPALV